MAKRRHISWPTRRVLDNIYRLLIWMDPNHKNSWPKKYYLSTLTSQTIFESKLRTSASRIDYVVTCDLWHSSIFSIFGLDNCLGAFGIHFWTTIGKKTIIGWNESKNIISNNIVWFNIFVLISNFPMWNITRLVAKILISRKNYWEEVKEKM